MRDAVYGEDELVTVQNGEGERFPVTIHGVREDDDEEPLYFVQGRFGVCAWVRESDIIERASSERRTAMREASVSRRSSGMV